MSYILDALRKADADRERGHVPSIHAQPVLPGAGPASAARAPRAAPWVALGALLLIAAVGLTWWLAGGSAQRGAPVVVATAAPVAAALPNPAAMPATPTAPASTASTSTSPEPATTAHATRAAAPKPRPKSATQASARPNAAATTSAQSDKANGSGSHAGKIYTISELPDDIRRQLPAISVGGSMYSPVRANRILIVGGQVLREGDRITPEVTLEQVRVKSAVLNYKGYRYLVDF